MNIEMTKCPQGRSAGVAERMVPFIGYTAACSENHLQLMWPDNETEVDYLNFASVSDTVAEIITQAEGRPISIGVSGAWGTGKSSMIKLIQASMSNPDRCPSDTRFVFVDFNAWLYQGYDDARAALMEVIANKLGRDRRRAGEAGRQGQGPPGKDQLAPRRQARRKLHRRHVLGTPADRTPRTTLGHRPPRVNGRTGLRRVAGRRRRADSSRRTSFLPT